VHATADLLFQGRFAILLRGHAVKFYPRGDALSLALLYQEGETVIRVSDTGPGISRDRTRSGDPNASIAQTKVETSKVWAWALSMVRRDHKIA